MAEFQKVQGTNVSALQNEMVPTWKNTFNTDLERYGQIQHAASTAKSCGYPYFAWNDWIYNTEDLTRTNFSAELLDA